jgi:amino acid adenylation domain-containing protein
MRTSLLRLDELEHILLLTSHHIVSDAWSAEILFREVGELYKAFSSGRPSPLSPLPIQYADFAEWQRDWLQGAVLEEQLAYWKKQLAGVSDMLALPNDHPRPPVQTFRGAYKSLTLPRMLSEQLIELSRRKGATTFMTLLAAFDVLLARYTGLEDIVVGSPIAGRNREEIERLIGFFVNTLVLRADLSGNPSFTEVLKRVREVALEAYAHQEVPFEKLVEELEPERSLGHSPLFQVMFALHHAPQAEFGLRGLTLEQIKTETKTSKFDLSLFVADEADGLTCIAEYNTDLFDEPTIERLLGHYQGVLEAVVANADQRISELPLFTEGQREQLVVEWNGTGAEVPPGTIDDLFETQVERTPNAVAVKSGDRQLTYVELNIRANQLARHLRRLGVGPEVRVGVCVERSLEMIVGLLGILKAGGAYVPLEPAYPPERISFILDDSRALLLLTQQRFSQSLRATNVQTICLDRDWPEIARESGENPAGGAVAERTENSAHLIYTSGSTGQPKGVLSAHRASVNRFAWMWGRYPFAAGEVCCQKTALSFVDSIWEIFGPLLQGVPLVIIPDEIVKDPQLFVAALAANKVTRLVLVPSLLRVILELGEDLARQLSDLRYCVCSGETLPVELAKIFRAKIPGTKLINLYGSSEVAADVTCYEVNNVDGLSTIPIGRPIANTEVYILDANLVLAPLGVPGEIYVGGDGLARGYLNRAELTAEKFVAHPFGCLAGARLFRTGDSGRYLPDGNIEYRGRRDTQVKVRGFRIELGEIEAQLASHTQVHQAVVIARDDERGDKQLVAYVVAAGEAPANNELRAHLRRKLPDHMIPAAFVLLETLPLTASGKVNRLALPAPDRDHLVAGDAFVAPRTQTEEILASVWADVLDTADVGVNDDFFALGGHSLLLARIAARIRETFQLELPLRALFEAPTVAALAERIETARRNAEGLEDVPLVAVSRAGPLPLSFAQERLWFFDQLEPNSSAYNIPRVLRLNGPLDTNALRRSLYTIVARHEVLRTSFLNDSGKPALSIAASAAVEIPFFDLSQLPAGDRDEGTRELANRETQRPFDLAQGPLLRAALVRLGEEEHVLLLTMHHIVSDGWSIGILMRELVVFYNAVIATAGPVAAALPALAAQYVDFAVWQRQWLSGAALQKQLHYWREQLAGAPPVIDLPLDRPRPALRSERGARRSFTIAKEITDKLKALARGERATLFMTLLTAFQWLLSCLTNQDDIVVGSPTAGRNRPECEVLIGYFVNTLVLRAEFSGDPDFRESLRRARAVALGAFANQDVPFEKLVEELKPARGLQYNPLFQVWFVLQNALVERQEFNGLAVESLVIDSATTRHDLQLTLWETANGLEGAFTYSTDLFDADTIACMAEQFNTLLAIVAEQPDIVLSALRAAVSETGGAYRNTTSVRLEEASRRKLKSTKRKVLTGPQASAAEELWTNPSR